MKKLFSLLIVALLSMTAWGKVVTIDFTELYTATTTLTTVTQDEVTLTFDKATGSNAPVYNNNGKEVRMYKGTTMKVDADANYTITKVEFTFTQSMWQQSPSSADVGTILSSGNWTGNAASILFTNNYEQNTQIRFSKMEVTIVGGEVPQPDKVAAPVFNPAGGEFSEASFAVTVDCATQGATIQVYPVVNGEFDYQNMDQFFPGNNGYATGTLYVTETTQYAACAFKNGMDNSDTTYVTFTKVEPTCDAPTFNPASGQTFNNELEVTITGPEGSTIYYVVNDSPEYEELSPVTVTLTETSTITAYAELNGVESDIVEATYTKNEVTPPEPWEGTVVYRATQDKGDYDGDYASSEAKQYTVSKEEVPGVSFTVSSGLPADNGYRIYKSNTITFNSQVGDITKIEFYCTANGTAKYGPGNLHDTNNVGSYTYVNKVGTWTGSASQILFTAVENQVRCDSIIVTVGGEPVVIVPAPVINPNGAVFTDTQEVTLTATEGTIYYSYDEVTWTEYTEPLLLTATTTVHAKAVKDGIESQVAHATFTKRTAISNLGEVNYAESVNYIYNGNAVVTYKNGKNLWIRDAQGNGLIYGDSIANGNFENGDVLAAGWVAKSTVYQGLPELQYPTGVVATGEKAAADPYNYTEADVVAANVNAYAYVENLTLTKLESDTTHRTWVTTDGLKVYNKFFIADSVLNIEDGKTYNVLGIVGLYKNASMAEAEPELFIIEATEVVASEWELGDVNHDHTIDVGDVTALIAYILGNDPGEFYLSEANVDGDAEDSIDVGDVTALIAIILNN